MEYAFFNLHLHIVYNKLFKSVVHLHVPTAVSKQNLYVCKYFHRDTLTLLYVMLNRYNYCFHRSRRKRSTSRHRARSVPWTTWSIDQAVAIRRFSMTKNTWRTLIIRLHQFHKHHRYFLRNSMKEKLFHIFPPKNTFSCKIVRAHSGAFDYNIFFKQKRKF